jgi:hypothetical protein
VHVAGQVQFERAFRFARVVVWQKAPEIGIRKDAVFEVVEPDSRFSQPLAGLLGTCLRQPLR